MTQNELREHRDRHFLSRLTGTPDLGARTIEAIELVSDSYGPADGALFARRFLEEELDTGPDGIGEWVYRQAAGTLLARGHEAEARAFRTVADTSAVLATASIQWHSRFLARPVTATERDARRLFADGNVRLLDAEDGIRGTLGADGARYTPAVITAEDGASRRAVIVTTHAGTAETVTDFSDELSHVAWLGDRMSPGPSAGGPAGLALPLSSCAAGPDCRTAREEKVLIGLLWHALAPEGPACLLTARSFATCTRAEIYLAWEDAGGGEGRPGIAEVRDELARRMLRAPGWAAPFTGWPFGDRALEYFDRLAATTVPARPIRTACRAIVTEDREALKAARAAGPGTAQAAHRVPHPLPAARMGPPPYQNRPGDPGPSPRL